MGGPEDTTSIGRSGSITCIACPSPSPCGSDFRNCVVPGETGIARATGPSAQADSKQTAPAAVKNWINFIIEVSNVATNRSFHAVWSNRLGI